jgi:PAS domain S-box-containing protein
LTREGKQLFVQITVHNTVIRGREALWVQVRDITEATQNEILLTEAMERYNLVSRATNDLIWDWDAASGKVSVNTAAKKMFQYDLEEMKRSTYRELIHPQDFGKVFDSMKRTLAEGRDTWTADCRIKTGKGNYRYVSSRAYILYDEEKRVRRVTGIVQDVTGIKNNALQLQEALERYDLTVKATHDVIWDWSAATHKVIVKGPLKENFGYGISEADKDWFFSRLHPEDQAGLKASIINAGLKRDPFWGREFRLKCADGSYKYVNNRAYIIYDDAGHAIRATGVIQVIQKQKEYETKIESQNVLLKEIAQICSHELRGPVASIRGLLILLNGDQVGEDENKKVFHYLDNAALRLDKVIHRVVEKANHVYYDME